MAWRERTLSILWNVLRPEDFGSTQRSAPTEKAADRRKWKKRRNGMLDDVIDQIVRAKKGTPTPADVVKTAATKVGTSRFIHDSLQDARL